MFNSYNPYNHFNRQPMGKLNKIIIIATLIFSMILLLAIFVFSKSSKTITKEHFSPYNKEELEKAKDIFNYFKF